MACNFSTSHKPTVTIQQRDQQGNGAMVPHPGPCESDHPSVRLRCGAHNLRTPGCVPDFKSLITMLQLLQPRYVMYGRSINIPISLVLHTIYKPLTATCLGTSCAQNWNIWKEDLLWMAMLPASCLLACYSGSESGFGLSLFRVG